MRRRGGGEERSGEMRAEGEEKKGQRGRRRKRGRKGGNSRKRTTYGEEEVKTGWESEEGCIDRQIEAFKYKIQRKKSKINR